MGHCSSGRTQKEKQKIRAMRLMCVLARYSHAWSPPARPTPFRAIYSSALHVACASQQPHLTNDAVRRFFGNLTIHATYIVYTATYVQGQIAAMWGANRATESSTFAPSTSDMLFAQWPQTETKILCIENCTARPGDDLQDAMSRLRLPHAVRDITQRYTTAVRL